MKKEAKFQNGTYQTMCDIFNENTIGAIHCTGHERINLKPCKFFKSSEKNASYYLPILKETIEIITSVECSADTQLNLF